ncbi:hypothetical protein M231_02070 [Tremella mesenterica]|uniref:Uncharacterized protein n=1 Tax=Tremella mesenterica TaxID=5217 RepID=A0A4Q1BRK9_TREME|nr:hypothetical protein M231_02070 [Tremella mesenterica]
MSSNEPQITERTTLLSTPGPSYQTAQPDVESPSSSAPIHTAPIYLDTLANDLLHQLRQNSSSTSSTKSSTEVLNTLQNLSIHRHAELAVLLYAVHILRKTATRPGRRRSGGNTNTKSLITALGDAVVEILDMGGSREQGEEEEFDRIFWSRWEVQKHEDVTRRRVDGVSVIDLLLPPYTTHRSHIWTHTLLPHVLQSAWYQGIVTPVTSSSGWYSRMGRLEKKITPCRTHLLHLLSFLVLLSLTVIVSLRPGMLSPYDDSPQKPTGSEVTWIVFALGSFLSTFAAPLQSILETYLCESHSATMFRENDIEQ